MEASVTGKEVTSKDSSDLLLLIKKCGEGDAVSLQEFFEQYAEDIYNFPVKVFHLDEDSASDFFLYAFEKLKNGRRFSSFQGRSSFRTWFYAVLRNLVLDWMRTLREIETVNYTKVGEDGQEYRLIENTPDTRSDESFSDEYFLKEFFLQKIEELGIELKTVFKLSYIYYLDLDSEEIDYVSRQSGKSVGEIYNYLANLKNFLAEKELKNIGTEDKITSIYLAILDLKMKRLIVNSKIENQTILSEKERLEMARIDRLLKKKYQQREKLLERKQKGHFIVRTPYKFISELTCIPEGSISVQMTRIMEKFRESEPVEI